VNESVVHAIANIREYARHLEYEVLGKPLSSNLLMEAL